MSGSIVFAGLWLGVGGIVGAIHAALLYRATIALAGTSRAPALVALHAGRFGFVVLALWLVAQYGALALISATAGFSIALLAARQFASRA